MGIPRAVIEPGPESARFHIHVEQGRGRGALTSLLAVPRTPDALSAALRDLHDPNGPADLDTRLGRLAAGAPEGTAFLVALDDLVWVFPSATAACRRVRDRDVESLAEAQVVRLKAGDRLELTDGDELLGRLTAEPVTALAPAPAVSRAAAPEDRPRRRIPVRRIAAVAGAFAGAAALVAAFFALSPRESVDRADASVAPSLEDRVVALLTGGSRRPEDGSAADSTTDVPAGLSADPPAAQSPPATEVEPASAPAPDIAAGAADATPATIDPDLPAVEGPAIRPAPWEFRAGGAITSSPFLAAGHVLFGSRDGKLYCLDAASGDLRWSRAAGSGVGSSPWEEEGLCFVGTYDGDVLAVDAASGDIVWRARTGGRVVASPVLLNGAVVIGSYDAHIHAFETETGEKRWSAATGGAVRASAEPLGADAVVVGSMDGVLHCLEIADGRTRWRHRAGSSVLASAAVDAKASRVFAGTQDGTVRCLDAATGDALWKVNLGADVNAKPRLAAGLLLVGTGRGRLVALDPDDGTVRWEVQASRGFDTTPLVLDDLVVAPSADGTLHFLDVRTGEVRERRRLPSEVFTSPAAGDGLLYVGTLRGTFHALDLP